MDIGAVKSRTFNPSSIRSNTHQAPVRAPLGLLTTALQKGLEPSFFWQDETSAIIGLGVLNKVEASGNGRFQRIGEQLTWRCTQDPDLCTGPWFGGFSFEPTVGGGFSAFGAARFILPRFVWTLNKGAQTATLQLRGAYTRKEWESVLSWSQEMVSGPEPISGGAQVVEGDFLAWQASMARVRRAFEQGATKKVVLSRDVMVRLSADFSPAQVLAGLPARSPAEAAFAFFAENGSCFLGLTPERLVKVDDERLVSEALAGTSSADDPDGHRLLASMKDRQEHAYVVEYLRERIRRFAQLVDMPDVPQIRKLGTISHLWTPIEARGQNLPSILALAETLHPSPAVGGVPMEAALSVIREAELRSRGWYAGGIGWVNAESNGRHKGDLRVALRSALIHEREARVFVGAGVVPASTDEGEWAETRLKSARTVAALGGD